MEIFDKVVHEAAHLETMQTVSKEDLVKMLTHILLFEEPAYTKQLEVLRRVATAYEQAKLKEDRMYSYPHLDLYLHIRHLPKSIF